MIEIHQMVAGFSSGDAISTYARELQKIFRSWGCASEIYVQPSSIDPAVINLCRPLASHRERSRRENIMIYHFSIGAFASDYFASLPDRKVMIYHNITPAHFFALFKPELASFLEKGRRELRDLAAVTELALGVSEYNRKELEAAGFEKTGVVPLAADWSGLEGAVSRKVLRRCRKWGEIILFVGRIVPNKRIDNLLKTFYYFKLIKPDARLVLVGKYLDTPVYYDYLQTIIHDLGLSDVIFTGHTTDAELLAYYSLADLYLSLSEHEGFCLPLLEAMHFKIPVLAYAAAAVPDTLDGAGVLVKGKNFPEIAELAAQLIDDREFRRKIVEEQSRRLERFRSLPLNSALRDLLRPAHSPTGAITPPGQGSAGADRSSPVESANTP